MSAPGPIAQLEERLNGIEEVVGSSPTGSTVRNDLTLAVAGAAQRDDRIYLVACVKKKRSTPAKAKDLYESSLFVKTRAYVEKTGRPWFILSAKHELVHPETVICPYEQTLNDMPIKARRAWARRVLRQLEPHLDGVRCVVFLAGKRYREHLEPDLRTRGIDVVVPMKGLGIGKMLGWLTERTQDHRADAEPPEGSL